MFDFDGANIGLVFLTLKSQCVCGLVLEHAVDGALVLAFLDGLTLVVLALASRKRDDQLGQATLVDEQAQRHDSDTGLLGITGDTTDFLTVEEQLAVTMGRVIIV